MQLIWNTLCLLCSYIDSFIHVTYCVVEAYYVVEGYKFNLGENDRDVQDCTQPSIRNISTALPRKETLRCLAHYR